MRMPVYTEDRKSPVPMMPRVVRILFVEDCKSDVFFVERILQDANYSNLYHITDVPRLVDASSRIDRDSFDLVMLDLKPSGY